MPWFQFPIDDRRRTGVLFPTVGDSDTTGFDARLPVYLNLAPNYDAQITPRYMSDRGTMIGTEGRYLFHRNTGHATYEHLDDDKATRRMQELYREPVKDELVGRRIEEIRAGGVTSCASLTPQKVERFAPIVLEAGLDVLVIQGTVVSAEHVSTRTEPLNLKQFIAGFDLPVIVGGCASYSTALHLMRTGAAGVGAPLDPRLGPGGPGAHGGRPGLPDRVSVRLHRAAAEPGASRDRPARKGE